MKDNRKKTKDLLFQPADMYQQAIELSFGVPYRRNNFAQEYIFMGQGIEDLVGIPADQIDFVQFKSLILEWHVIGEETTPRDAIKLARDFIDGKVKTYKADLKIRTPQGQVKWLSDSCVPVLDQETGKVIGSFGILQDITDRKDAEAEIRRSEALFRGIFEQSVMGIALSNIDEEIVATNSAFQRMLGYSEKELLTMTPAKFTHPEDIDFETEMVQEVLSGKRDTVQIEKRYIRQDKRVIWGHLTVSLVKDAEGAPLFFMGIVQDITERKKAEEALRVSEERFALFMKYLPVAVFIKDSETRPIYVNKYMQDAFGMKPSNDKTTEELFPGEVGRAMVDADKRALELGYTKMEEILRLVDGSFHVYETHKFAIPQREGEPLLGGVGVDITARKEAERALQESNRRYNELVEKIPVGVFRVCAPREGKPYFDYVSPRFCEMVDMTEEQLKSDMRAILGTLPPDQVEDFIESRRIAMENNEPFVWEGPMIVRGERRWTRVESYPTEIKENGMVVWDGIHIDITERKNAENERLEMERQIQQAQRLESLGVLAGGVAHDFNNILMAILGHADLALLEAPPASKMRNNISEILKASYRAAELCNQMLAYSGRGHFVVKNLNLNGLVLEMLQLLRTSISKHCELKLELAPDLLPIHADVTQIRQIIMNLITNASESIGEQTGTISIKTFCEFRDRDQLSQLRTKENIAPGNYVILEISDTGCGMDQQTLGQIFEPFFTTKFTGRGLGLSAVLGIVRGHRGGVKVESSPNVGTTFQILLPVSKSMDESEEIAGHMSDWNCVATALEGTVLLVDDEEAVREVAEKMLLWFGLKVITAADGEEALRVYAEEGENISCILLDLTMPAMSGEQVLQELRKIDSDVKVIASSGYDKKEMLMKFGKDEVAGFIQKPYTLAGLKIVLTGILPSR